MLPDYIIIGTARSGTSWLMKALHEHPEVNIPLQEIHYFTTHRERDLEWYESFFHGDGNVTVEKSVSYFRDECAEVIRDTLPDVELIVLLRDPIERVHSHYNRWLSSGEYDRSLDEALSPDSPMVREGLYHRHLQHYLEHFPRESVHVLLYDDFVRDNERFFRDVCGILGVDRDIKPSLLGSTYNPSRRPPAYPWLTRIKNSIVNFLHRHRLGDRLVAAAKSSGLASLFYSVTAREDPPELTDKIRHRLAEFYRDDTRRLQEFLDRDLSSWGPLRITS